MKNKLYYFIDKLVWNKLENSFIDLRSPNMDYRYWLTLECYEKKFIDEEITKSEIYCNHRHIVTCNISYDKDDCCSYYCSCCAFTMPYKPNFEELFLIDWEKVEV